MLQLRDGVVKFIEGVIDGRRAALRGHIYRGCEYTGEESCLIRRHVTALAEGISMM